MRKLILAMVIVFASLFASTPAANAAMIPPRYGDHVTYYSCSGPYYQYNIGWYYWCYADYDWWAEVFWGYSDMWVKAKAWYTA